MTIPTNGLDFYLPFDADMDEKIHSLTGTLSSSSAATYFMLSSDTSVGKFLRCIKTQGSSSYYLKYPGSESLMQYGTGDFSLSFWMRAPDWGNFTHVVFEKKYNDDYDGFVVFKVLAPLNLCCRLRKGSGEDSVDILTASAANSDKFIHWCFIRDAGGGRWYCNGLQEATSGELINECIEGGCNVDPGRAIGVNVSNSEIFKIGYSASWSSKQAVFDLKALRIYNRALSDSEITELSQEFSGTSSLDTVLVALDGARDALVTAINAKGGSLADNATLYQCAETVGSLSGGTSAEYYKCASVDTSAKTWSGYKAVQQENGGYTFEETVTTGLTYTSVTPVVGGIYSADALVNVAFLYDDMRNICTAYYKLDGNYRDSVNMYDGIPNKTTFVDGKIGRSAHTNGYSQYISLSNEVSVKGKTQVSYSGWCFIESNPNRDFYIVTEIANSSDYTRAAFGVSAALLPFAGVRTVATGDTGSFQKVTGTSTISTGTWYFLCAIFDLSNGNITLYVNGVSVGSLNVTASSFVNANPYRIRICEFDESGSGNIRVDEVGIWSKALSAAEVSELYNNGAGKSL